MIAFLLVVLIIIGVAILSTVCVVYEDVKTLRETATTKKATRKRKTV